MRTIKNRKTLLYIPTILVLLTIICLAYSTQVFAEDKYKVVNTSPKNWFKTENSDYNDDADIRTYYLYKIQISSPGYLEVKVKDGDLALYDRLPSSEVSWSEAEIEDLDDGETERISVDKGTYYLAPDSTSESMAQYTFTPVKPTANYCMKKAATLKAGKNVTACMSKKNYYSRWYKVKLKKKKSITFWSNAGDDIRIYNSKGKIIDKEHAGTQSTKWFTKKQKKGTYYIRILPSWSKVVTLKWK